MEYLLYIIFLGSEKPFILLTIWDWLNLDIAADQFQPIKLKQTPIMGWFSTRDFVTRAQ